MTGLPRRPIRVASIPALHPYIQHLAVPPGDVSDSVVRLQDPPPDVADPQPGQWWPPAMLEPGWPGAHAMDFDVAHLHFGFDAAKPADLQRWVDELRFLRRPLVVTVHDLMNPHFADQREHGRRLDVLIPAADALITLTAGAAAEIDQRWGRTAQVIAHPHIVPLHRLPDLRAAPGTTTAAPEFVIGVHAKSLRANLDPVPVLAALDAAVGKLPHTRVRVDVHSEVLTRTDLPATAFREFLQAKRNNPAWDFQVHERFTDDELWDYLEALDLCVLPYRFGTHSGWLEACVDVGTAVLVPDTGYFEHQHGHPSYSRASDVDQDRFSRVLQTIRSSPEIARRPRPDRRDQRRRIAAAHERIYRDVLRRM